MDQQQDVYPVYCLNEPLSDLHVLTAVDFFESSRHLQIEVLHRSEKESAGGEEYYLRCAAVSHLQREHREPWHSACRK
jgi:hypothetical protein